MTYPLIVALIAERNAGEWYARRVAEHTGRLHEQGQARAHTAAAEIDWHIARGHADRLDQLHASVRRGDTLNQAAAALWLTPEGLRSWLARHARDILAQLRANEQGAA